MLAIIQYRSEHEALAEFRRLDTGQMRKTYMGTDATSTVYATELQRFIFALVMAKAEIDAGASHNSSTSSQTTRRRSAL